MGSCITVQFIRLNQLVTKNIHNCKNFYFENLMEKFELNDFSEEIRNNVIPLVKKAYEQSQRK